MTINNKSERSYRGKCLGWPVTSYGGEWMMKSIFWGSPWTRGQCFVHHPRESKKQEYLYLVCTKTYSGYC